MIASQCAKKGTTPDFKCTFDIADGDVLFVSSELSNIKGWFISLDGKPQVTIYFIMFYYLLVNFSDFSHWFQVLGNVSNHWTNETSRRMVFVSPSI